MPGLGTQCPGLGDKVGSSLRFNSMISEVFFNLNDSVILPPSHTYAQAASAAQCGSQPYLFLLCGSMNSVLSVATRISVRCHHV